MGNKTIANPSNTKEILAKYNLKLNDRLGQNLLIDQNILNKIIEAAVLTDNDTVIEIGPGLGSLTQFILREPGLGKLIAVEKDKRLVSILKEIFTSSQNLELVQSDVLDINWNEFIAERGIKDSTFKVISNLPYYITTPVIMGLLESDVKPARMVFMVQKEVAERMAASPGTKAFGALSIAVQFYCQVRIIHEVPPTVFIPQPDVYSSIITLIPYTEPPYKAKDRKLFFRVVKAIFQQRRKTIKNSLIKASTVNFNKDDVLEALEQSGIDSRIRGEKLSIASIVELSNNLIK